MNWGDIPYGWVEMEEHPFGLAMMMFDYHRTAYGDAIVYSSNRRRLTDFGCIKELPPPVRYYVHPIVKEMYEADNHVPASEDV